ncbi:MAG: hypothetical protein D8M58_17870 [Calditrichaeota bacterium]|nr:MAG: hypothetical protein DWQ03_01785 [Calditrichota bacterium]MBL1207276.1 hypothetical protein [Calditrichota bacterium]NOG47109.1 hypothetical protein [Calditrichota bacterium]
MLNSLKTLFMFIFVVLFLTGQAHKNSDIILLNSTENLTLLNVKAEAVTFKGKKGLRVEKVTNIDESKNSGTLVLIENSDFRNGTIELELSGEPAPGTGKRAKGFVGVAFRIDNTDHNNYECIYLRPVNGRAENQLQRNHSVQYISHPEFPWQRLRKEQPGVYETYVDLVPGEWIKFKIVVSGKSARLYVHGNSQPTLIVHDLKHGERQGLIGLWLYRSTIAHYRNLKVIVSDE